MGNFNRGNRSSGRRSGNRGFGGRDAGRGSMCPAVCDACGEPCEVPFKPTGDRPVYCDACFGKQGGKQGDRPARSRVRDFGSRDFGRGDMHQATCDQCGAACEVPFRPTSGKPVYCDACFGKNKDGDRKSGGRDAGPNQFKSELAGLHVKLDKILQFLMPGEALKPASKPPIIQVKPDTKKTQPVVIQEAVKEAAKSKPAAKKGVKPAAVKEETPVKTVKKAASPKKVSKKTSGKKKK